MAGKGTISITFKLDGDGKGFRAIAQDANGLRTVMASTLEQSEALKTSLVNWSAAVQGLQGVDKAVNQIASQLNSITSESEEFNKAMKMANTMAGKDSTGFKELKGEIADLAKEIPIVRDQLANGLYQTISNGVPEDNWIEFLNTSARSAVGGIADINKVVGVTSTLIKNYGLEWSAAADIQDKIQLTAKNGVTSFEQLAQALPRVTGNAATLGVSIDELMGTFATLTGVSGNTAEVSTQLGAIFTALVKPSSEAAEMAAKMGIQFDAAAIKAAGGFQNFLNQLDSSVKAYAQANGVLEQEVYSKLFGSAEAIRALIPLQGELADKFTANVDSMVNSAGTMDAAYADMSSHGEAVNQMLRNQWAAFVDVIAGVTSAAQPYINFTAGLLSTGSSAAILITTFKQLNIQQVAVATRAKLASVVMATLGLRGKSVSAGMRFFSSAMSNCAHSATALKFALRGLIIATGIGAAVAIVTAIIAHFANTTDDATNSVKKLDDATDDYTQAAAAAKVQIDRDTKALGDLIKAKKSTKEAVQHLNEAYGDLFGAHKTAEEWYKILTEKSQLYIKQIGYEAQAKALAAKVAENAINKEIAAERLADWERANRDKMRRGRKDKVTGLTEMYSADKEWKDLNKTLTDFSATEAELQKRLDVISKKTGEISAETNRGLAGATGEVKVSEMTWQQCTDAIEANDKALKNTTDPKKIRELIAQNTQLKTRKKVLESMTGLGTQRTHTGRINPDNNAIWTENASIIKEYDDNIRILDDRLQTATLDEAVLINQQKAIMIAGRDAIRNAGIEVEKNSLQWHENARNLAEVSENIRILDEKLQTATIEEAALINQQKAALEEQAAAFRNAGKTVDKNTPVWNEHANTLKSISDNISILNERLQNATIEEAALLNQQIKAWEKKAEAIRNAGEESKSTFDIMRNGYGSLKGIGDGVESITDALEGNGNAWQTVTGIVDGFLQIYDGIKTIVGIIDMLSVATTTQTTAKTAEGVATEVTTAAQTANAVAAETNAAAQIPVIAANKLATASYMELAAAAYFAAHASIPFAGFGIASGFVTAATAMVQAIGVMPFANGGIVSGPTVGLIGEYAGASNNPEVVAPLDKLRGMLNPVDGFSGGVVKFKIDGRTLVGILEKETNLKNRS